ncbi:MAG: hypothetical protein MJE68_31110, partial [Proteobacteria bacterium]|nr:hypothetical protein [Pseudomonadota bacterium]
MKRNHWDKFKIGPEMDPRKKYPIMENTKLRKFRNIEDVNSEDEVPLAKLRRKWETKKNKTENVTENITENMTENTKEIRPATKNIEEGMPPLKRRRTRPENGTWEDKHNVIKQPNCYRILEVEVRRLTVAAVDSTLLVNFYLSGDEVDRIALSFLPEDAPEGLIPIVCGSDGNCFCRAISRLIYGDESHHIEIQIRIVREAVRRKQLYLNDTFLNLGQPDAARSRLKMYSIYS